MVDKRPRIPEFPLSNHGLLFLIDMRKRNFHQGYILMAAGLGALLTTAQAQLAIDLNDFEPSLTVFIAPDGTSARMEEDGLFPPSILSNDPGFGDPVVILPEIGGIGQMLSFTFDFTEPSGNDDEFRATVLDGTTGVSVGPAFEFSSLMSDAGIVSFDLSPLAGFTLGLLFELDSLGGDTKLDSTVVVSDVVLTNIPEPETYALCVSAALVSFVVWRRRA